MSEQNIHAWKKAKKSRESAESWNNLPNGNKYQNDSFAISLAHCKAPQLNRAGQQHCGGQNYWETEAGFNEAILEHIVKDWTSIYPKVLDILKNKEAAKLQACQEYINQMQAFINESSEQSK